MTSISPQDRTHHIVVTAIYELPFGRGRTFLSGARGWVDHVAGGWKVQGIYQGQTGPPIGFGNIFYGNINDIRLPRAERRSSAGSTPTPASSATAARRSSTTSAPSRCG